MDGPIYYTIVSDEAERELARVHQGCRKRGAGGGGGRRADQLTLFQPGGADSAQPLLLAWYPQHVSPSGITAYNQKYKQVLLAYILYVMPLVRLFSMLPRFAGDAMLNKIQTLVALLHHQKEFCAPQTHLCTYVVHDFFQQLNSGSDLST